MHVPATTTLTTTTAYLSQRITSHAGTARQTFFFDANLDHVSAQGIEERLLLCLPSHAAAVYSQGRRRRKSENNVSIHA
jgi:hypothetical protein